VTFLLEMPGHRISMFSSGVVIVRQDDDLLVFEIAVEFLSLLPRPHGVAAAGQT
jgi:hypothetical protein